VTSVPNDHRKRGRPCREERRLRSFLTIYATAEALLLKGENTAALEKVREGIANINKILSDKQAKAPTTPEKEQDDGDKEAGA